MEIAKKWKWLGVNVWEHSLSLYTNKPTWSSNHKFWELTRGEDVDVFGFGFLFDRNLKPETLYKIVNNELIEVK